MNTFESVLTVAAPLLVSALLTGLARRIALSRGVLDVPNARSSHDRPTPRGGGIAIVLASVGAWGTLTLLRVLPVDVFMALAGGGIAVASVGLLDDHFQLSARVRFTVHVAAALWAVMWLGGLPPFVVGEHVVSLGWVGYVLAVLAIVWTLNLFNFMDGIDGIAASEAVFVAWSGVLLAVIGGSTSGTSMAALALGASACGFLLWNWPPARIFMGDVGSGYIGYAIAVLALAAGRDNPAALLAWLLLGGTFFVDATATLIRRLARRERVHEAHRSHAYQHLARRWRSHRHVTVTMLLVNVLWLLPWAVVAVRYPSLGAWSVAAAFLPLAIAVVAAGAGRSETPSG